MEGKCCHCSPIFCDWLKNVEWVHWFRMKFAGEHDEPVSGFLSARPSLSPSSPSWCSAPSARLCTSPWRSSCPVTWSMETREGHYSSHFLLLSQSRTELPDSESTAVNEEDQSHVINVSVVFPGGRRSGRRVHKLSPAVPPAVHPSETWLAASDTELQTLWLAAWSEKSYYQ